MVMVFFGTNRNMTGTPEEIEFGDGFNPDGPGALRFGWADVPESCFDDDTKLQHFSKHVYVFCRVFFDEDPHVVSHIFDDVSPLETLLQFLCSKGIPNAPADHRSKEQTAQQSSCDSVSCPEGSQSDRANQRTCGY